MQQFSQMFIQMFKRNWPKFFIGLVIILLIVSAVLKALSPPIVAIPQTATYIQSNFYGQKTTFQNISYSGAQPEVPQQMTVDRQTATSTTIDDVLSQMVKNYQLTQLTSPSNVWTGQSYSLSKTAVTNSYTLSNDVFTPTQTLLDKTLAIATAQKFMQSYFPGIQTSVLENNIGYYLTANEPVETTADKATGAYLPFTYQVDGYPVYFQNNSSYPFGFSIDGDLNIIRVDFSPFFIQLTPLQKQNTISINQAVQNMNAGKASLINIGLDGAGVDNISEVKSADLSSVSLEYRTDEKTDFVYPFYRFSGTATNGTGQSFTVEIITPAIQTTVQQ